MRVDHHSSMSLCVSTLNVVILFVARPLMLNTQRLSSLAFNLRDGSETVESKLTAMMKRLAIKYKIISIVCINSLIIVHYW